MLIHTPTGTREVRAFLEIKSDKNGRCEDYFACAWRIEVMGHFNQIAVVLRGKDGQWVFRHRIRLYHDDIVWGSSDERVAQEVPARDKQEAVAFARGAYEYALGMYRGHWTHKGVTVTDEWADIDSDMHDLVQEKLAMVLTANPINSITVDKLPGETEDECLDRAAEQARLIERGKKGN